MKVTISYPRGILLAAIVSGGLWVGVVAAVRAVCR
jgi:hypothetical protein